MNLRLRPLIALGILLIPLMGLFTSTPADVFELVISPACEVKQYVDSKWTLVPSAPLKGTHFTLVKSFPSGLYLLSFHSALYSTPQECLSLFKAGPPAPEEELPPPTEPTPSPSNSKVVPRWSIDLRGAEPIASTLNTSLEIDGRIGYAFSPKKIGFLSISSFSSTASSTNANSSEGDSSLSIQIGLRGNFSPGKFAPYVAALAGFSKLTRDIVVTGASGGEVTSSQTIPSIALEAGALYSFTEQFKGVVAVNYNMLSFNKATVTESSLATFPVGSTISGTESFGHLALQLGVLYEF